jgi:hypothetical protein
MVMPTWKVGVRALMRPAMAMEAAIWARFIRPLRLETADLLM